MEFQFEWKRSGDILGDFLRLIFLLEEGLERLGAFPEGTLGQKLAQVEGYLQEQDGELVRGLWELIALRNRVIHERAPLSEDQLRWASQRVARLLLFLERQGYYHWQELQLALEVLQDFPPPPPFRITVIEPPRAQAPNLPPGNRPLEIPGRWAAARPLELARQVLPWPKQPRRRV